MALLFFRMVTGQKIGLKQQQQNVVRKLGLGALCGNHVMLNRLCWRFQPDNENTSEVMKALRVNILVNSTISTLCLKLNFSILKHPR